MQNCGRESASCVSESGSGRRPNPPSSQDVKRLWTEHREHLLRRAAWWFRRRTAITDEEDIVLSAVGSLCRGVRAGKVDFDQNEDRSLLGLLLKIIDRKAINHWHRERRDKRGGRAPETSCGAVSLRDEDRVRVEDAVHEASTESACDAVDALEALLNGADETLRRIVLMRLDGMVLDDIADELGVSTATVSRKLLRVRHHWEQVLRGSSDVTSSADRSH